MLSNSRIIESSDSISAVMAIRSYSWLFVAIFQAWLNKISPTLGVATIRGYYSTFLFSDDSRVRSKLKREALHENSALTRLSFECSKT